MEMEVSAKAQNVSLIDKMELIKLRSELKSFEYDFNKSQRKYIKQMLEHCENSKLVKVITLELSKLEVEPENTERHTEVYLQILKGNNSKSDNYKKLLIEMEAYAKEYYEKAKLLHLRFDHLSNV